MDSLEDGYNAVVIGASGGIGSAFVDHLRGDPRCARVIGLHRRSDPPIDITDEPSVAAAAAWLRDTAPTVHLILDATGALSLDGRRPEKRLAELDPQIMARQFAVNATGPALLLKHLAPLLPRRQRGIFATLSARVGSIEDNRHGGWISYRASKAALNQIVRTAAIEMRWRQPHAVCVALQPGTVDTRLSAPWYSGDGSDLLTPAESTRRLLEVLDALGTEASGGLYDHAGERIPG
ncbi:MAG: SDR family NAD(P)-dependent oxidoreductase [Halofilum sp. (in: g-proteobacteria)]|nr:SDR family NAD(P)-dependent oxidoreductase [Halofilum sp. (in: g-proteobacteria)]